jgi:tetratricopeptide (TPR) repeat protein
MEAQGDYSGALAQWQVVLEFVPDDPEAAAAAAEARERLLQEQAAAVRDVENQAVIRTRFATGLDLYNEGDLVGARTEWNAILAIDPENEGAKDYLGRTNLKIDEAVRGNAASAKRLEAEGRLTEAIAEWNNVQQYHPDDPQARAAITRLRARIESMSQDYSATQKKLRIVTLYNDALQAYNAAVTMRPCATCASCWRYSPTTPTRRSSMT